ncbi:MAG: hypothetical protein V4665_00180 [Patescibacteria group bacterium]
MRKERTVFIVGLWVIILPFLGFPTSWRKALFVITGFALIYLSYRFYQHASAKRPSPLAENRSKSFIDNVGSAE